MAAGERAGDRGPMFEFLVRDAQGHELVDGCDLLARSLGFGERDALPPGLVQTSAAAGGVALGAFAGARLVGFSFALPGTGPELFSCGLAVEEGWRGRGVARRLKLAQRDAALARGAKRIRWTADPLAAPALRLYLGGLRARLVDYAPELYAAVRPAKVPPDDVVIDWSLTAAQPVGRPAARVEIPGDRRGMGDDELAAWRLGVRREMREVLRDGAVGTGVAIADGRAWVLFSEAA
jgi:predicted GNAT superfamily acetyltransferase